MLRRQECGRQHWGKNGKADIDLVVKAFNIRTKLTKACADMDIAIRAGDKTGGDAFEKSIIQLDALSILIGATVAFTSEVAKDHGDCLKHMMETLVGICDGCKDMLVEACKEKLRTQLIKVGAQASLLAVVCKGDVQNRTWYHDVKD